MNLCAIVVAMFLSTGGSTDYLQLVRQAHSEYDAGHFAASEKLLRSAIQMLRPGDDNLRAAALLELGDVYVALDNLSDAETAYSQGLGIYKRLSDKTHIASALRNLGSTYSLQARLDEALSVLQEALKLTKTIPNVDPGLKAGVLNGLGMVYYRQAKYDKAAAFFNEGLLTITLSGLKLETAQLLTNLGAVYIAKRKFQKAEELLKQALQAREAEVGPVHPELIFALTALGVLYTDSKKYDEAEAAYLRALKILELPKPHLETRMARVLHVLSTTYAKAGRKREAEETLAKAATIARRNLNEHPDMVTIVENYSALLSKRGKIDEADQLRSEARRARISAGLVIKAHSP